MENDSNFSGWAVVELFGHQKEVGFVTTRYFGDKAMFQIDVPDIPAREEVTDRPRWIGDILTPAGAKIAAEAVPGRSRLVSPGAVYALNPCDEDVARHQAERNVSGREIKVVSLPPSVALSAGEPEDAESEELEEELPNF